MSLGPRIRTLRQRQRLRLQDVAERCGFTKSLLSKIETGAVAPPIATLTRIAGALGVGTASLLAEGGTARTVIERAAPASRATDKGYRFRLLLGERVDKAMQPYLFTARRGEVKPSGLRHPGEEFLHVLAGELELRVGDVRWRLAAGDGAYFDSDEEHDVAPLSAEATWLAVFLDRPAAVPAKPGARRRRDHDQEPR